MASRLDAVQIAVPRAVTDAAQQHAAQRQPVVAQEQATAAVRQDVRAREQRPGEVEGRAGREVRDDLINAATERDPSGRRQRNRQQPGAALVQSASVDADSPPKPDETPDGKGTRVDLRM